MSDENNIGMGEKATVTATRLVLLCSKAIEEYREALREQEYDETGPLTIIPSDFEIARDVVVEFFEERRKTPEPEKSSGNAAAMREALENIERVARFCAEMPRRSPGYPTDAERADVLYSRIAELGRVALAALAAPARNCDRFATLEDADYAYANRETTGLRFSSYSDFEAWLFAPASPQDKPKSCPS